MKVSREHLNGFGIDLMNEVVQRRAIKHECEENEGYCETLFPDLYD